MRLRHLERMFGPQERDPLASLLARAVPAPSRAAEGGRGGHPLAFREGPGTLGGFPEARQGLRRERDASDIARDSPSLYRGLSSYDAPFRDWQERFAPAKPPQAVAPPGGAVLPGDRRVFHPLGVNAPASLIDGRPADIVTGQSLRSYQVQAFKRPGTTVPCVQRSVRKEVMFALRKAGRGYKVKHRRSWHSNIGC